MTVDNIVQETNKNPSDELIGMIDSMVMTYKVTTEERDRQVKAIIEKGRLEGLEDKQIGDLIRIALKKHGLSDRTIRNALPDELKDKKMQQVRAHRLEYVRKEDTDIDQDVDQPVYREPDRVEPRPQWTGKTPVEIEQSFTTDKGFHIMNVNPNVPVADKTDMRDKKIDRDTSYTTEARLNLRDNKMNRDFYVMLTVNCYPDKQTVEIEPIDKANIVYVKPDQ